MKTLRNAVIAGIFFGLTILAERFGHPYCASMFLGITIGETLSIPIRAIRSIAGILKKFHIRKDVSPIPCEPK